MSIEAIEDVLKRSAMTPEDLAKRMFMTADEFEAIRSGRVRPRRLHLAGLDRAALSLALERRDPSFVSPQFGWQMVRYAMLVLQEQRPVEVEATASEPAKDEPLRERVAVPPPAKRSRVLGATG